MTRLIISVMRNVFIIMSIVAAYAALTACTSTDKQNMAMLNEPFKQEREFIKEAIKDRSPDVQKVDIIGNSVVYTHIFDGIIDVKSYTYDGDICVEAERVYTFPDQMSALRHYRRAVERAELYDDIQLMKNEVRYNLKAAQTDIETKGLTKEQLKQKFDKQIADAKADMERQKEKMKADIKRDGQYIENDMDCCKKDCKGSKCKGK